MGDAIAILAAVIYLERPQTQQADEGGATPEAKAYVSHLELSGVNMAASESFMKQQVVENPEARKIANMAQAYCVPFVPHCFMSPIGTMASAHVCASVPNFLICEWHWINYLELWLSFAKEGEIISKGYITVTDRPGTGVELNEEAARKAQIPGTPWFEA
jgi:hypothetical protein